MTTTLFWTIDPKILITDVSKGKNAFIPRDTMTFEEKVNAISRLVIVLSVIGFCITHKYSICAVGVLTLGILVALYNYHVGSGVEGYTNLNADDNSNFNSNGGNVDPLSDGAKKVAPSEDMTTPTKSNNYQLDKAAAKVDELVQTASVDVSSVPKQDFHTISKYNPMGNVLLTEITDAPNRKSAPPSFNPEIQQDINDATKKQTQYLYPGIKNTDKQLYGDLGSNFKFDNEMMRNFYSTANTRVCNDQGAFAQFLYGDMPSGKSSGPDGAFARVQDNPRYNLY